MTDVSARDDDILTAWMTDLMATPIIRAVRARRPRKAKRQPPTPSYHADGTLVRPGRKIRVLTGQSFGVVTVIGDTPTRTTPTQWRVQCVCGAERDMWLSNLVAQPPPVCIHPGTWPRGPQPVVYQIGEERCTMREYAARHGMKLNTVYQRYHRRVLGAIRLEESHDVASL